MSQQEYWNAYWENACDPSQLLRVLRRVWESIYWMSAIFKSCLVQNTCNIVMHRVQDKWEENITTYIHLIPLSVSFPKLSNFCFGWLVVKWCGKEVQIVKRVKVKWVHNHKLRETLVQRTYHLNRPKRSWNEKLTRKS